VAQGAKYNALFTTPAPFNTLLWRGVAMSDDGYYEVYYSLLDDAPPIENVFLKARFQCSMAFQKSGQ